jgi:hypothetical protein
MHVGSNQAAATKVASLSITSANPATIRICDFSLEDVAPARLQQDSREAVGDITDKKTTELLNELKKYPGVN